MAKKKDFRKDRFTSQDSEGMTFRDSKGKVIDPKKSQGKTKKKALLEKAASLFFPNIPSPQGVKKVAALLKEVKGER